MKNESYLIELNLEQMQYLRDLINLRMNDLNYMVDNMQLDGYVKERDLLLDAGKKFSEKLGLSRSGFPVFYYLTQYHFSGQFSQLAFFCLLHEVIV